MKRLFILIGLFICLVINAQDFEWATRSYGKNDTMAFDKRSDANNWFMQDVTIDITIWGSENIDGEFYVGGYDPMVSRLTGKQDWKNYPELNGVDVSPLVADSTGVYFVPNADTTRYTYKIVIPNYCFQKPAYRYIMNETDSSNYVILFSAKKK